MKDVDDDDYQPSKTRIKKDLLELQTLALKLTELPGADLAGIEMGERLADAIQELRGLKAHGARKRQMKFVAKLLRDIDLSPLHQVLALRQEEHHMASDQFHRAENWRERLLSGDEALTSWLEAHPGGNARQLRSLIKNARIERAAAEADAQSGKPMRKGKAYRELFKLLLAALEPGEQGPW